MNKNVMALAVAGVLAAPAAFAQSSNVQLYGRANVGFDSYKAEGASGGTLNGPVAGTTSAGAATDFKRRNRIFDNSSRVGLRGTEDLGNGLKAIFQIETGVNIDSGNNLGQNGTANASSGFWASRDSFAGLDSNFGRVTFGRQSIFWSNGVNAQFAANYINREVPWADGSQMGRITRGTAGASSVARVSNVVAYTSPTLYGLNGTVSYSPGAQEAVGPNVAGGTDTDGRIWGITGRGEWGPWYGQVDWVQNKNNTPMLLAPLPNTQAGLYAWKAGASFAYMPGARVGLIYVRTKSNNAQGLAVGDWVNQNAWAVNWEHTFGNVQALAQYGWMGEMKDCENTVAAGIVSCNDTKAKSWMVGARYLLSKRTWLYASYNEVRNKSNQFVDYQGATYSSVAAPAASGVLGADPKIWAVGLFHAF